MIRLTAVFLTLLAAGTTLADGTVYCNGVGHVATAAACQSALEAREGHHPAPAPVTSAPAHDEPWEPEAVPCRVDPDPWPPLRPANISVSTTDGLTTIAWAPPANLDGAHCHVDAYAVTATSLAEGDTAYDSGDVPGLAVTTRRLEPGAQYDVEVSAWSDECEAWSEAGVYTYQY